MPGGVMLPEFYNQLVALWGESIRFTVPMLVALAFLPMFGIGGLTGLPLGLAASDVSLPGRRITD